MSQRSLNVKSGYATDNVLDMGWWMALNLRKRLENSATLYIYDIVTSILEAFVNQALDNKLGPVVICNSAREVAEKAVRTSIHNVIL